MPADQTRFRLNAQKLFLTYPKCPVPPAEVLSLLSSAFAPTYTIKQYLIVRERHQPTEEQQVSNLPGDPHIQAVIMLNKKANFRNCHFADLTYDGSTYHGQYESVRNWSASCNYCRKDRQIEEYVEDLTPSSDNENRPPHFGYTDEEITEARQQPTKDNLLKKLSEIFDNEENVVPSQKRKLDEVLNGNTSQKRRLSDADLGKITEFVLEDLGETEKEDKKKMLKLAMDENEYLTKFWKTMKIEERKIQVRKFIQFANIMFDVNLKAKNEN